MPVLNVVMLVAGRTRLTNQAVRSLVEHTSVEFTLTVVLEPGYEWHMPFPLLSNCLGEQLLDNPLPHCTGAARNAGVEAAREHFGTGDLLYLSDNDTWYAPGWDIALLKAHDAYGDQAKIIGGGCHPFLQVRKSGLHGWFQLNGQPYGLHEREAISGYSWLLEWETWDRWGPLDAHAQGVRQSEDFAMCQKVRKDGYVVASLLPEVVVHTGLTDSFGQKTPGWELMEKAIPEGVIAE
jgi:hypothetical protein